MESNAVWHQVQEGQGPTSARTRHGQQDRVSTSAAARSPKPHRNHRGYPGMTSDNRTTPSNLGPPLIPLDTTNTVNGSVATATTATTTKDSVGSTKGRKTGKKTVTLAQTYAGPLDCVEDLDPPRSVRQNGLPREVVCPSADSAMSGSGGSAVSMDQLSTTCLGAEVTVKPRPQLEASKTYHIFPTETLVKEPSLPGAPPLRLWSPGKSSTMVLSRLAGEAGMGIKSSGREGVTGGAGGGAASHLFDPGLGSPFRTSPRLTRPRTEEGRVRSTVEFITKDLVTGAPRHTVNLCPDWHRVTASGASVTGSSTAASSGLKANTIQPDLPPTFQLKGVSTQPRLAAGGGAGAVTRRKRGLSKTAIGRAKKDAGLQLESTDRKSWSASTTDTTTSSGKGDNLNSQSRRKSQQVGLDMAAAGSTSAINSSRQPGGITPPTLGPVPYFKFWNSSIPPKSRESRRVAGGGSRRGERVGFRVGLGMEGGELNLAQLAQLMLADETVRQDRGLADAAHKVLEEQHRLEQLQATQQHQQEQAVAQRGAGQGNAASGVWIIPNCVGLWHGARFMASLVKNAMGTASLLIHTQASKNNLINLLGTRQYNEYQGKVAPLTEYAMSDLTKRFAHNQHGEALYCTGVF